MCTYRVVYGVLSISPQCKLKPTGYQPNLRCFASLDSRNSQQTTQDKTCDIVSLSETFLRPVSSIESHETIEQIRTVQKSYQEKQMSTSTIVYGLYQGQLLIHQSFYSQFFENGSGPKKCLRKTKFIQKNDAFLQIMGVPPQDLEQNAKNIK